MIQYYLIFLSALVGLGVSSWLFAESSERVFLSRGIKSKFLGSVIAPIFTSLPELFVIFFSILNLNFKTSNEVIGGITLGEPFMVMTIGLSIFSLFTISKIKHKLKDFNNGTVFIYIFISSDLILVGFIFPEFKILVSLLLLMIYFIFLLTSYMNVDAKENSYNEKDNLKNFLIFLVSVLLLSFSSYYITASIANISENLRISAFLISLLIVPVGTILPELFNSIFWGRLGKLDLALGNLSGEAVIFITIYPSFSLLAGKTFVSFDSIFVLVNISLSSALTYSFWKLWKGGVSIISINIIFLIFYIIFLG